MQEGDVAGTIVQVQPVPDIAVTVSAAGGASVTVTVPEVEPAAPLFFAVIVYVTPV